MSKIFSPDNRLFTFINKVIDTFWLGCLWCILTLTAPLAAFFTENTIIFIIGIVIGVILCGPASTALYYATVKVIRRSRSYATKEFFHSFKQNFITGGVASLIFGVFAYLMYVDFQYANVTIDQGNSFGNVMFVVFLAGTVIMVLALVWIFPILSRFTVNIPGLFRNTFIISAKHLIRTILLILLLGVVGVLCYIFAEFLLYMIIIIPLIPALIALTSSLIVEPVLKKYLGESAGDPEETGIDEWYRE